MHGDRIATTHRSTHRDERFGLPSCHPDGQSLSQAMVMLGLSSAPGAHRQVTVAEVGVAFRSAIRAAHPDHAGAQSTVRSTYVIAARDILMRFLQAR